MKTKILFTVSLFALAAASYLFINSRQAVGSDRSASPLSKTATDISDADIRSQGSSVPPSQADIASSPANIRVPVDVLKRARIRIYSPNMELTEDFIKTASLTAAEVALISDLTQETMDGIRQERALSARIEEQSPEKAKIVVGISDESLERRLTALKAGVARLLDPAVSEFYSSSLDDQLLRRTSALFKGAVYEIERKQSNVTQGLTLFDVKTSITGYRERQAGAIMSTTYTKEQLLAELPVAGNLRLVLN